MESGLPMLNCLLQHTLRSLCSNSDTSSSNTSSKWVYAVFWRILPRNYPPPKWDYGGSALDLSKGNKRNWILVWEDGFCDLYECEQAGSGYIKGRFGADVFFKMSHEVYSYGEGLVGKVAADNSHKWVFSDPTTEGDSTFISSWNVSIEPQPRAWEVQFKSGIQTIAIVSVREGIVQLGSFNKIVEDVNLVINIQRKLSYLQSIPGVFAMQRPYLPLQHPYTLKPITTHETTTVSTYDKRPQQQHGLKRLFDEIPDHHHRHSPPASKSINMGWNTPSWPIPPLLPSMMTSCNVGDLLSKRPSVMPYSIEPTDHTLKPSDGGDGVYSIKVKSSTSLSFLDSFEEDRKPNNLNGGGTTREQQGEIMIREPLNLN